MPLIHNKAHCNSLIHKAKAHDTTIHDRLVSILHNKDYRQNAYISAQSRYVAYMSNVLSLCMITEQTETRE